jgi:hypothetical protein
MTRCGGARNLLAHLDTCVDGQCPKCAPVWRHELRVQAQATAGHQYGAPQQSASLGAAVIRPQAAHQAGSAGPASPASHQQAMDWQSFAGPQHPPEHPQGQDRRYSAGPQAPPHQPRPGFGIQVKRQRLSSLDRQTGRVLEEAKRRLGQDGYVVERDLGQLGQGVAAVYLQQKQAEAHAEAQAMAAVRNKQQRAGGAVAMDWQQQQDRPPVAAFPNQQPPQQGTAGAVLQQNLQELRDSLGTAIHTQEQAEDALLKQHEHQQANAAYAKQQQNMLGRPGRPSTLGQPPISGNKRARGTDGMPGAGIEPCSSST